MSAERFRQPPPASQRYLVLACLCGVAAIAYIQRAAISVPAKEIAGDLKFRDLAQDMGWIQSVWYFSYAAFQIPSGWYADWIGSRRALALFCVLWSGATLASCCATDFWTLLVLWGVMGAAQAGAFPCAAKEISQLFPNSERARASGLLASGMAIGGAVAPLLTGSLLEQFAEPSAGLNMERWRLVLAAYAIPGFLWVAAYLALVPAVGNSLHPQSVSMPRPLRWSAVLQSPPLLLLCAQQFFRAAGMVFFLTWFPTFLQQTRDVSQLQSGLLTTIAGVGGFVGSVSGGFASDWLLRQTGNARLSRQGLAVLGMAVCSLLIVASYFVADVQASIALISLGAFFATFGGVSGYTVAITFGGKHVATVFGAMNMCGNIGAALFPLTAGWLVARTGNWNLILFLFAGIMALDAICWALLNPRGTLSGDDDDPS